MKRERERDVSASTPSSVTACELQRVVFHLEGLCHHKVVPCGACVCFLFLVLVAKKMGCE